MPVEVRRATKKDIPSVLGLIRELAEYERAVDEVEVTEEVLIEDGFGSHPLFHLLVAEEAEDAPILGIAFYYFAYSTWKGKILYLDDLIVSHEQRRKGIGEQLMAALAQEAKKANVRQMRWHVLDWNEPAIRFYEKINTHLDPHWVTCKMGQKQIDQLANEQFNRSTP